MSIKDSRDWEVFNKLCENLNINNGIVANEEQEESRVKKLLNVLKGKLKSKQVGSGFTEVEETKSFTVGGATYPSAYSLKFSLGLMRKKDKVNIIVGGPDDDGYYRYLFYVNDKMIDSKKIKMIEKRLLAYLTNTLVTV